MLLNRNKKIARYIEFWELILLFSYKVKYFYLFCFELCHVFQFYLQCTRRLVTAVINILAYVCTIIINKIDCTGTYYIDINVYRKSVNTGYTTHTNMQNT